MDLVEIKEDNANRHPWEFSRADCMLKILSPYSADLQYADVGSGDGYFASRFAERLNKPIYTVDIGYEKNETKGKLILLNDIKYLPENSIDVVLLMDVIEHIEDVDSFMEELMPRIKPGGTLLITVPAFLSLTTAHDTFMKHFRRYTKPTLKATLLKHNIQIDRMFYFYTSLFFARAISVIAGKLLGSENNGGAGIWAYPPNHFITRFVRGVFDIDFNINNALSKLKINPPGLSICAICRKKS